MSKGFIMGINGGGTAKLFGAIGVKYPVGSTCTCTGKNTGEVLKAKDTSGQVVFAVPEADTWTVKISKVADGVETSKTKDVEISEEERCVNITMSYELVLLDENGLASGYTVGEYSISPAIDVSNYTVMEISAAVTWAAAVAYGGNVGLSETADGEMAASVWVTGTETQTYTLDISGLNGIFFFSTDYALELTEKNYISFGNGGVTIGIYSITFR